MITKAVPGSVTAEDTLSKNDFLSIVKELSKIKTIKTRKKIEYFNFPCAFDIETTSFYEGDNKRAIMYEWTFGIYNFITIGRTWKEFIDLMDEIVEILQLHTERRLVVYVHNLAFEFQFMRHLFTWEKVFAIEERKPIEALTVGGIDFKCSYKLSGYSLERLAMNLTKYKCKKLVGDLDYSKLRTSETVLSIEELNYCINDVLVVICYIQELIEQEGDISLIPLTKTGFVRKLCRNACLYDGDDKYHTKFKRYRALMESLTLNKEVYEMLQEAFAGGFTHANAMYADDIMHDVSSHDFTSSYPYVMISEKFPMSSPKSVYITSVDDMENYLDKYCCLFEIEFFGIRATAEFENYISISKCRELRGYVSNNGRLVEAEHCVLTITEQDFDIIRYFYEWDDIEIGEFLIFEKAYLPTDFILSIVELYEKKTMLKGIEGKEPEYLRSKENINSCYGMTVTDICRDNIVYVNGEWSKEVPDEEEAVIRNDKSLRRFLYYPWGVWVTAYARHNLFTAIAEFGDDYVYADTDSIKGINSEKHLQYFKEYNEDVIRKLKKASEFHNLSIERLSPKTIKGEIKTLGVWDDEGVYTRFKTLGAKRYMTEKDGEISLTVSGVNKKVAVPYLKSIYGDKIFENFQEGLQIPPQYTGKLTHTYIDFETSGVVTDYQGHKSTYHEMSSIHLEEAGYDFSMSQDFINYILQIKTREVE